MAVKLPLMLSEPKHGVHPVVKRHSSSVSYIVAVLMMRLWVLLIQRWTVRCENYLRVIALSVRLGETFMENRDDINAAHAQA
jgi:hypothetical protein